MSTRTPLEWLFLHGEESSDPGPTPQEHGYWVPVAKTWAELGFEGIDDRPPPRTMASQIGQIPTDGGDFLPFLVEYRQIVELGMPRKEMLKVLDELGAKHPSIAKLLGGKLSRLFVENELRTLPGCGANTAQRLYDATFLSAEQVQAATVKQLMAVKGIGKATAEKLKG
jgi:hypothetical protein